MLGAVAMPSDDAPPAAVAARPRRPRCAVCWLLRSAAESGASPAPRGSLRRVRICVA